MIILILISLSTVYIIVNYKPKKNEKEDTIITNSSIEKKKKEETEIDEQLLKVDIKGEINNPGIYELKSSSRVIDVIEKAGGLTENANTTVINLSKKITDEMVIIIYSNKQVEDFSKTKEIEKQVQNNCINPSEESLKNDACITEKETTISGKISINTATLEELQTLPGIGEEKAKNIIKYREENGLFTAIEDLTKINGIGESIFAKIKENITL